MDRHGFLPLDMDQWIEVGFRSVGGGGVVGLGLSFDDGSLCSAVVGGVTRKRW